MTLEPSLGSSSTVRTESAVVTTTKCSSTEGESIVANDDTNNDAQAYQLRALTSRDLGTGWSVRGR